MIKVYKSFFAAAVMILVFASAGCVEMPSGNDPDWSGGHSPDEQDGTGGPDEGPGYLTPATPYPTATSSMTSPTLSSRPTATQPTPDPYVLLYNRTTEFNISHSTDAFTFNLTAPPLIIEFDVEPKMITRDKHTTSLSGSKGDVVVKQTYPSETSWFTVTIRDRESGTIVAEDGFGKRFSSETHKRIFVGKLGDYLIQLSGDDVTVHVSIRAGGI